MTKTRVLLFTLTVFVLAFFGYFLILYARGYHFNFKTLKFLPKGILVVKTDPSGAQIFIDKELRGASDSNFSLSPGNYDADIKKAGYLDWSKRLTIEKETVTEINASLYKQAPAFSPVTTDGALSPTASPDFTKIAFAQKEGLWLIENIFFPIGFPRDPKKITDGDLTDATWEFSPNSHDILITSSTGVFLIDGSTFTPQGQRINIASSKEATLASWQKEIHDREATKMGSLPEEMVDILTRKASALLFSPDETKVIYTASASASLAENLIKPFPGASTQSQDRNIKVDHTYIYDIKEDRNFLIDNGSGPLLIGASFLPGVNRRLFWLPDSGNLVLGERDKITVLDYDGTNRQVIFSGGYLAPYVFPYGKKLLILTNLGADSQPPNLYSITIK